MVSVVCMNCLMASIAAVCPLHKELRHGRIVTVMSTVTELPHGLQYRFCTSAKPCFLPKKFCRLTSFCDSLYRATKMGIFYKYIFLSADS